MSPVAGCLSHLLIALGLRFAWIPRDRPLPDGDHGWDRHPWGWHPCQGPRAHTGADGTRKEGSVSLTDTIPCWSVTPLAVTDIPAGSDAPTGTDAPLQALTLLRGTGTPARDSARTLPGSDVPFEGAAGSRVSLRAEGSCPQQPAVPGKGPNIPMGNPMREHLRLSWLCSQHNAWAQVTVTASWRATRN